MKEWKTIRIPKDEWDKIEKKAIAENKKTGSRIGVATIVRQWIKNNT